MTRLVFLEAFAAIAAPAFAAALLLAAGVSAEVAANADAAASRAAFAQLAPVLRHPRCANCHTAASGPRQGDEGRAHMPPVDPGADGAGRGLPCNVCHRSENNAATGVPGAPGWRVAMTGLDWRSAPLADLCASIRDAGVNGGFSAQAVAEHITDDALVGWAWAPGKNPSGADRATPPLSRADAAAAARAWADMGAACPAPEAAP